MRAWDRSPARLVIALSVAAALAIFVVYTALAGNGVADAHAEHARRAHRRASRSSARSSARSQATRTRRRPALPPQGHRQARRRRRVAVVYHGTVPDLFKTGRDIVVDGSAAERCLRREARLARDEVPVEVHAGEVLET